jgi:hypothetical protein
MVYVRGWIGWVLEKEKEIMVNKTKYTHMCVCLCVRVCARGIHLILYRQDICALMHYFYDELKKRALKNEASIESYEEYGHKN